MTEPQPDADASLSVKHGLPELLFFLAVCLGLIGLMILYSHHPVVLVFSYVCVPAFALLGCWFLWLLFNRPVVLRIDHVGIYYSPIGHRTIPWKEITEIAEIDNGNSTVFLVLLAHPLTFYWDNRSKGLRGWWDRQNDKRYGQFLQISTLGLATTRATVRDALRRHASQHPSIRIGRR